MAHVVATDFSGRALQLGNEQLIRRLPFGSNWTKLRIAVLTTWAVPIPEPAVDAQVVVGWWGLLLAVVNGIRNYDDPDLNLIGSAFGGGTGASIFGGEILHRVTGGQHTTYRGPSAADTIKRLVKIGPTLTVTNGSNITYYAGAADTVRFIWLADIYKDLAGGTAWTVQPWYYTAIPVDTDYTAFLATCEDEAGAGSLGPGLTATPAYTGTPDLDSIMIYSNRSYPTLWIHAMAAVRFA